MLAQLEGKDPAQAQKASGQQFVASPISVRSQKELLKLCEMGLSAHQIDDSHSTIL